MLYRCKRLASSSYRNTPKTFYAELKKGDTSLNIFYFLAGSYKADLFSQPLAQVAFNIYLDKKNSREKDVSAYFAILVFNDLTEEAAPYQEEKQIEVHYKMGFLSVQSEKYGTGCTSTYGNFKLGQESDALGRPFTYFSDNLVQLFKEAKKME
jgi:hypothetical protein